MFSQKQLDVFRAVVSLRSVSGAARRLNLSQPSVSRILGDLESRIGVPLFIRRSKGVIPTPEAEAFLKEVERCYAALENLEDAAAQIARKERGTLSFATITAASLEVVPRTLARLGVQDRNISVSWQIKSSKWVIDFARAGALKTGFANVLHMPSGMHILHESTVPHMCWLPQDHPLAAQTDDLDLRSLRSLSVVGLLGQVAEELRVRNIGQNAHAPLVVETSLAALTLAEACGAVPIVDAFTARYWTARHGGVARPISDLPSYRFAVFEPLGIRASLIDREFQEVLIDEINTAKEWAEKPPTRIGYS
jgi:DNA-binding transcriptional LysR family regulator